MQWSNVQWDNAQLGIAQWRIIAQWSIGQQSIVQWSIAWLSTVHWNIVERSHAAIWSYTDTVL